MEEVSKTPATTVDGIAPKPAEDTKVDPQSADVDVVPREQYKSLESSYTTTRQELFALAATAAKADPKTILSISDEKVQRKVINDLYGVNNLAELQYAYGKEFWRKSDAKEEGDSELESWKLKARKFEVISESQKLDSAIALAKVKNPELLKSEEDTEKLKKEVSLLSSELSTEERLDRALRIVYGDYTASKAAAIRNMANAQAGKSAASTSEKKDDTTKPASDLLAYAREKGYLSAKK